MTARGGDEGRGIRLRANVVFCLLAAVLLGLNVRLFQLARHYSDRGRRLGRVQQSLVVPLPARPGNLIARAGSQGIPLAASRQVPSCFVDPGLFDEEDFAEVPVALGEILGVDPMVLNEALFQRRERRFVWVRRGISEAQARAVQELDRRAVGLVYEWRRQYPAGALAGPVIGFRRIDGVAGAGLELSQDAHLRAVDGERVLVADAGRRAFTALPGESTLPRDGEHVLLTLDTVIQGYLQRALRESCETHGAKWGTGVVVEPATGRVLAMASVPTFNPEDYARTPAEAMANRAITHPYEPGSVAKPLYAAAAVQEGLVRWSSRIDCEQGTYYASRGGRITDHGHSYGLIDLTEVIVVSSNIGMAKIGEKLGNDGLFEWSRRYGFGSQTGIGLPGEEEGLLRPREKWDGYSMRRVPFGQEISVTALQLAMAFATLCNGGELLRPRLVEAIAAPDGTVRWRSRRELVRRLLDRPVAAGAVEAMRQVVESDGGTGRRARMDRYTCFGKTGTAQIAGPGGYEDGAYVGSFIAAAPVDEPRLLCLISIYWPERSKGYYGGVVAAPYVKDVLQRSLAYLDVPPDKPDAAGAER